MTGPEPTADASTDGMASDYDSHSEYQRRVADAGASLVAECVAALELPAPPDPVVIVDLGAATGRNSMAALGQAVTAVRDRDAQLPVVCVHNDLPTNDWTALFANLADSPDSYLNASGPPVLPMASAVSFFEPTVPAGMADLEVSYSAAHWLREQPELTVPQGIYPCEAVGEARARLATQAAHDWEAFLSARAADLSAGGRLLVECVGTEVAPDGTAQVSARELLAAMDAVAHDLVDDGLLSSEALERYVFPVYPRTVDEASAPLLGPTSSLAGAFEVVDISTGPVANPYLERWRRDGDAAAYGRDYAAFVRGFAESALLVTSPRR